MKNILSIITIILLFVSMVSCTDEGTDGLDIAVFPELEKGGFVKFPDGEIPPPTVSFVEPTEASLNLTLEDFNGNASLYELDVQATIAGTTYLIDNYIVVDQFPSEILLSVEEIASALNLTLDEISFGDNFLFIATVTTTDGREFVGDAPVYDEDNGVILKGNTEPQLLTNPESYNSAMRFNFTLACPEFTRDDLIGTYEVVQLGFAAFFGETLFTREVIAGPEDNQVIIVGGEFTSQGSDDLVLTVDFTTGEVTEVNNDGFVFNLGGTDAFYVLIGGLALPCSGSGVIDLTMDFNTFPGNTHGFVLQKQ